MARGEGRTHRLPWCDHARAKGTVRIEPRLAMEHYSLEVPAAFALVSVSKASGTGPSKRARTAAGSVLATPWLATVINPLVPREKLGNVLKGM